MQRTSRSNAVHIDLAGSAAVQGEVNEHDVIRDVEDAVGGSGDDLISGNQFDNHLTGVDGNDIEAGEAGEAGADVLVGADGADLLLPSPGVLPFGVGPDGVRDIMEGGNLGRSDANPGDVAVVVVADNDFANDCPMVIPQ